MLLKLFLAFTIIPIIEIYILIKIGSIFGAISSIFLVILTGIMGAYLARMQGLKTFLSIQESLSSGSLPSEQLLDAVLILVAGILLLTPGFLTDSIGFLLLIQTTRNFIKFWLHRKFGTQNISNKPEDTIIEQ